MIFPEMIFPELLIAQNQELKRLKWSNQRKQSYIRHKYGKVHRNFLTEQEMEDFLEYLKSLPTPKNTSFKLLMQQNGY